MKWTFEESRVHILLFPIPSTVRLITGHTATGHSNTCQELIRPITMNTMPVNRIFTIPWVNSVLLLPPRPNSPQWATASLSRPHDHTHPTPERTPLDEWSARRRDLYLTTHNTHNTQTSMPPAGFEPVIATSEWPQTYVLDRAGTEDRQSVLSPKET